MGDLSPIGAGASGVKAPVRIMVVDDSIIARAVYKRLISVESDLSLAGQASTAEEALVLLQTLRVDVILLDLQMPGMGGLNALPQIIALARGAKILVASSLTVEGAEHTMAALSQGATDTMPKPVAGQFDNAYRTAIVEKIRALGARVSAKAAQAAQAASRPALQRKTGKPARVLAIGASTGGILALRLFFESLPAKIGIPILVTQHLPVSFLPAFAEQIARFSKRPARLAEAGMELCADEVLIAPGSSHLMVDEVGGKLTVKLSRMPAASGCMPSVDPMLSSLCKATSGECLAVILSGMGRDGTEGAGAIAAAGGSIMAQDEGSSAVWGMPGSIAAAGLASEILPPGKLADKVALVRKRG